MRARSSQVKSWVELSAGKNPELRKRTELLLKSDTSAGRRAASGHDAFISLWLIELGQAEP